MWGFIFATATWTIVLPWWSFPWAVLGEMSTSETTQVPALPIWGIMLWGVLLGTVVPFLLVLGSLRRIGAQRAGIVATTEPLWAGLIAILSSARCSLGCRPSVAAWWSPGWCSPRLRDASALARRLDLSRAPFNQFRGHHCRCGSAGHISKAGK